MIKSKPKTLLHKIFWEYVAFQGEFHLRVRGGVEFNQNLEKWNCTLAVWKNHIGVPPNWFDISSAAQNSPEVMWALELLEISFPPSHIDRKSRWNLLPQKCLMRILLKLAWWEMLDECNKTLHSVRRWPHIGSSPHLIYMIYIYIWYISGHRHIRCESTKASSLHHLRTKNHMQGLNWKLWHCNSFFFNWKRKMEKKQFF